jgi:glyoxylase I family protein
MRSAKSLFILLSLLAVVLISNSSLAVTKGKALERVTGIGGFFFKAHDPKALEEWYETHLGINKAPTSLEQSVWQQEKGPTIFSAFPQNTTYFGKKDWMLNFRVNNLDALVKQLRADSIKVDVVPEQYPNGRFAHLEDPEGNPIELWEPKTPLHKK